MLSPAGKGRWEVHPFGVLGHLADAEPGSELRAGTQSAKPAPLSLTEPKEFIPVPRLTEGHGVAGFGLPRAGQKPKARQLLSCTWMPAEKLWM